MFEVVQLKYIVAALVYSGLGIVIFGICFTIFDLITPRISLWKELVEKQNIAFAIFLGSIAFGIATIIASAIHG